MSPDDDRKIETEEISSEQDDEVIGTAIRRSLLILVALAAIAAIIFLVRSCEPAAGPEQAIDSTAPQRVDTEGPRDIPEVTFTDITEEAGIDFVHHNGATGDRFLPETMGGGVAFFDYDNDGDQDLLLIDSNRWPGESGEPGRSRLYENDGSGHFEDKTQQVGFDFAGYGTGIAVGDVDNDGWVDVFIAAVGENALYRNVAGSQGRAFVNVSAAAGVAGDAGEWSSSSAFFDYDNDGDLDLMVGNYVRWSREIDREVNYQLTGIGRAYGPPVNYQGTYPYLYRNDSTPSSGLSFTDVSEQAGVRVSNPATGGPVAKTLGVLPIDVDGDGFLDVFISNDTVQNFFFRNQTDGTFEEVGELYGLAYGRDGNATGAMGVDAGYFRNDEQLAIGIGNFANEMTSLYVSQGGNTLFADQAIGEGIGAASRRNLTFGLNFVDYDLDGFLDLLQVNGHLEEEIGTVDPSQQYRQPTQLFWNAGVDSSRTFLEVEARGALELPLVGRASSYADIDGDGDLDFLLAQTGDRPILVRNDQQLGHHWLRVALIGNGTSSNRDAIGAVVEVHTAGGDGTGTTVQRRQVMPSRGYQAQVELPVTFGLGTATSVELLKVRWPDGEIEERADLTVDQLLEIEQSP